MLIPKKNRREVYKFLFNGARGKARLPAGLLGCMQCGSARWWLTTAVARRGRAVRREGLQPAEAPGAGCAQPAGHQAHAELQVQGAGHRALCLAPLLLVSPSSPAGRQLAFSRRAAAHPGCRAAVRGRTSGDTHLDLPPPSPPSPLSAHRFLTDTGIDFLREYLNLPAEVGQCAPFHRHHALALLCMNACVTDPLAGKELSCIGNTALFGASDSMLQKFYQL